MLDVFCGGVCGSEAGEGKAVEGGEDGGAVEFCECVV